MNSLHVQYQIRDVFSLCCWVQALAGFSRYDTVFLSYDRVAVCLLFTDFSRFNRNLITSNVLFTCGSNQSERFPSHITLYALRFSINIGPFSPTSSRQ